MPRLHYVQCPSDRRVAIGGRTGIEIWDITIGELVQRLNGHQASVSGISFTNCGKYLISCGEDGTVKLWDLEQGRIIQHIINTDPFDRTQFAADPKAVLNRLTPFPL